MTNPIRIKSSDSLGNVAYVHRDARGSFRCTLTNGLSASFSYAGILHDEMGCRFELDACITASQALRVICRHGSVAHSYSIVRVGWLEEGDDISIPAIEALSDLEAELQRLKALLPDVAGQIDQVAVDRARALLVNAGRR